ncbi:MAG TPA: capsular polysaccharide synthesis protein [Fimbriimonadaceae bacterium]|jgi:hypothetical protein
MSIPRVIYSLWLQGKGQAPPAVRLCFDRWEALNPGYELKILEERDVAHLLAETSIDRAAMPHQALSDIVRTLLLLKNGGIWVDASLFPVVPLDNWLPQVVEKTGFFAFNWYGPSEDLNPELKRISSWFLASDKGHILFQKMWEQIERFWSTPRTLGLYGGRMLPACPVASVEPGSELTRRYPYYWFHYLFQYITETDPEAAAAWDACQKISAEPPHAVQTLVFAGKPYTDDRLIEAARSASVQKLTWRDEFPLHLLAAL